MTYLGRLALIGGTLSRLSWLFLFDRLTFLTRSKEIVTDSLKKLGGVYIKFLQLLAVNNQQIQQWLGQTDLTIFEKVEAEPIDLESFLTKELTPTQRQALTEVEMTPFAGGSFAQVYRAKLAHNQQPVIIKVLRPAQSKFVKFDLRLMKIIVNIVHFLLPSDLFNLKKLFADFAPATLTEIDYQRETEMALYFHHYFQQKNELIEVPFTYAELSTKKLIIQDYVGGISVAELLALQQIEPGVDLNQKVAQELHSNLPVQIETLATELLATNFEADYIPADPHPGNIKILSNNRIGLIDFGIVAPRPLYQTGFLNLLERMAEIYGEQLNIIKLTLTGLDFFDPELLQALQMLDVIWPRENQSRTYLEELLDVADQKFQAKLDSGRVQNMVKQKKILQIMIEVADRDNIFGLKLDIPDAMMFKAALICLELVRSFYSPTEFAPQMEKIIRTVIDRTSDQLADLDQGYKPVQLSLTEAIELIMDWLSNIAGKDLAVYQQVIGNLKV